MCIRDSDKDGSTVVIGSYPVNPDASYKWYYEDSPDTVLGTEPVYTVTSDNTGKVLCVDAVSYTHLVSNFVTVAVLTLVTFVGSGLISALPAAVTAAFSYITPAIFGAIIMDYAMKNVKYNLPLIIAGVVFFLLFKALGLSSVWITLFVVITGMFVSRIMFTYWKKKDSAKAS